MATNDWRARLLEAYGTLISHPGQERVHRQLRRWLKVEARGPRDVRRRGLRWTVDPTDAAHHSLFWFGEYDRWDMYHAKRFVAPGATILDIGANIGYYAISLAAHLKRQCLVYAFEPFPSTFQLLAKHVEWNGMGACIRPAELAVSESVGTAVLQVWQGHANSGRPTLGAASGGPDSMWAAGPTVAVTTLDDFCRDADIGRVNFVKIDVEGLEERVLNGGANVLSRDHPTIMFELNPTTLGQAGSPADRVVAILRRHGYRLYEAKRARLEPLSERPEQRDSMNAFALH